MKKRWFIIMSTTVCALIFGYLMMTFSGEASYIFSTPTDLKVTSKMAPELKQLSQQLSSRCNQCWIGSFFFPGLGQFLMGNLLHTLLFLSGFGIVIGLPILLITYGKSMEAVIFASIGFCIGLASLYTWNIIDAYYLYQLNMIQVITP